MSTFVGHVTMNGYLALCRVVCMSVSKFRVCCARISCVRCLCSAFTSALPILVRRVARFLVQFISWLATSEIISRDIFQLHVMLLFLAMDIRRLGEELDCTLP